MSARAGLLTGLLAWSLLGSAAAGPPDDVQEVVTFLELRLQELDRNLARCASELLDSDSRAAITSLRIQEAMRGRRQGEMTFSDVVAIFTTRQYVAAQRARVVNCTEQTQRARNEVQGLLHDPARLRVAALELRALHAHERQASAAALRAWGARARALLEELIARPAEGFLDRSAALLRNLEALERVHTSSWRRGENAEILAGAIALYTALRDAGPAVRAEQVLASDLDHFESQRARALANAQSGGMLLDRANLAEASRRVREATRALIEARRTLDARRDVARRLTAEPDTSVVPASGQAVSP